MTPYSYSGWAIEQRSRGPLAETPRLLGPLIQTKLKPIYDDFSKWVEKNAFTKSGTIKDQAIFEAGLKKMDELKNALGPYLGTAPPSTVWEVRQAIEWWPWRRMPIQTAGHRIALFNTRAQARQALPPRWSANGNDHWYVPVRVLVTIAADDPRDAITGLELSGMTAPMFIYRGLTAGPGRKKGAMAIIPTEKIEAAIDGLSEPPLDARRIQQIIRLRDVDAERLVELRALYPDDAVDGITDIELGFLLGVTAEKGA